MNSSSSIQGVLQLYTLPRSPASSPSSGGEEGLVSQLPRVLQSSLLSHSTPHRKDRLLLCPNHNRQISSRSIHHSPQKDHSRTLPREPQTSVLFKLDLQQVIYTHLLSGFLPTRPTHVQHYLCKGQGKRFFLNLRLL